MSRKTSENKDPPPVVDDRPSADDHGGVGDACNDGTISGRCAEAPAKHSCGTGGDEPPPGCPHGPSCFLCDREADRCNLLEPRGVAQSSARHPQPWHEAPADHALSDTDDDDGAPLLPPRDTDSDDDELDFIFPEPLPYADPSPLAAFVPDGAEDPCPICLDPDRPVDVCVGRCGHAFHADCLDTWAQRRPTCPLCRTPFAWLFSHGFLLGAPRHHDGLLPPRVVDELNR